MGKKILIITGDAGESYETLYALHRFQEAEYEPVWAAPSKRRLNRVMHDFEPGWDTYIERPANHPQAPPKMGIERRSALKRELADLLSGESLLM